MTYYHIIRYLSTNVSSMKNENAAAAILAVCIAIPFAFYHASKVKRQNLSYMAPRQRGTLQSLLNKTLTIYLTIYRTIYRTIFGQRNRTHPTLHMLFVVQICCSHAVVHRLLFACCVVHAGTVLILINQHASKICHTCRTSPVLPHPNKRLQPLANKALNGTAVLR